MHDLFVSYRRKEAARVDALVAALPAEGLSVSGSTESGSTTWFRERAMRHPAPGEATPPIEVDPGKPFFRLRGAVGRDDQAAFAIELQQPWTAPDAVAASTVRQLYLFANDFRFMYWNNHAIPDDPLRVMVTRLA